MNVVEDDLDRIRVRELVFAHEALPPMLTLAVPIQHDETFEMSRLPPKELSSYVLKTGLPKDAKTPDGSQVNPPPPPCCSTFPPTVVLWATTPSACDEIMLPVTVACLIVVEARGAHRVATDHDRRAVLNFEVAVDRRVGAGRTERGDERFSSPQCLPPSARRFAHVTSCPSAEADNRRGSRQAVRRAKPRRRRGQ
jgi:hypothetical protein